MGHEIDLKNKAVRTDLAIELIDKPKASEIDNIKITNINLDEAQAKEINKKKGTYTTIEFEDVTDYDNKQKVKKIFIKELKKMLKSIKIKEDSVGLIIGLGNEKSTPDSLGPLVIEKTLVTNHLYLYDDLQKGFRRTCALAPGVTGQTGIETSSLIKSIVDSFKPDFVITIDALASSSVERVNKTIQMTDAGINPGSGVGNKRKEISKDILGIPVIAIGVPTVVDAASIVSDTIKYMYQHFAYQKDNYNNPAFKLTSGINYLKYIKNPIQMEDKEKILGIVGTLNENQTKQLIYEILNPIGYNLMVTPKEEDFVIDKLSELISQGINESLHKNINS